MATDLIRFGGDGAPLNAEADLEIIRSLQIGAESGDPEAVHEFRSVIAELRFNDMIEGIDDDELHAETIAH